jgi:hypothetical protein
MNLGLFPKGNLLFLREVGFSLGNNHILEEKELKLSQGTI